MKKIILVSLAIFILWSVLDFIIHGLILGSSYEVTAALWRPMDEMKMGLMRIVVFISSVTFVLIYVLFFAVKGFVPALKYGLLYGIGAGIAMGYGSYAVMPIPYTMAFVWFTGSVAKTTLGGLLLGLIIRDKA